MNRLDDGLLAANALAGAMRVRDDGAFLLVWESIADDDRMAVAMCMARLLQKSQDSVADLLRGEG